MQKEEAEEALQVWVATQVEWEKRQDPIELHIAKLIANSMWPGSRFTYWRTPADLHQSRKEAFIRAAHVTIDEVRNQLPPILADMLFEKWLANIRRQHPNDRRTR